MDSAFARVSFYTSLSGRETLKESHTNISESILVVTRASSGIGAATTRELARRGATVILVARRADELSRITNDITHVGQMRSQFQPM